jgi:hypothetical protein
MPDDELYEVEALSQDLFALAVPAPQQVAAAPVEVVPPPVIAEGEERRSGMERREAWQTRATFGGGDRRSVHHPFGRRSTDRPADKS